jgi:hypothetical protein
LSRRRELAAQPVVQHRKTFPGARRDLQDRRIGVDFRDVGDRLRGRTFLAIRNGVPRTAMARWPVLTDPQTWQLVAYITSLKGR